MTTGTHSSRQVKVTSHFFGMTTATRAICHRADHSGASLGSAVIAQKKMVAECADGRSKDVKAGPKVYSYL